MKIEEGVPIPPQTRRTSPTAQLARQMKVHQSVVCKTFSEYQTVKRTIYSLGGKAMTRRLESGWRVWRVA